MSLLARQVVSVPGPNQHAVEFLEPPLHGGFQESTRSLRDELLFMLRTCLFCQCCRCCDTADAIRPLGSPAPQNNNIASTFSSRSTPSS